MQLEHLLRTDRYGKPWVLSGKDAIGTKLVYLLNMRPYTDPLHPEMGIDMRAKYRYCREEDLDDLQEDIRKQIEAYFPTDLALGCDIKVSIDGEHIRTTIVVDDTAYNFETDDNGTEFSIADALGNEEPADNEDDGLDPWYGDNTDNGPLFDNASVYPGDSGNI